MQEIYQVGIIGGGLAGLCSALHLQKLGISCIVWEKGEYPRHKVCGEYVSNETLGYLRHLGFDPYDHGAVSINQLRVTHWNGVSKTSPLDVGAFGISRFSFDHQLYLLALEKGIPVKLMENVTHTEKTEDGFQVKTSTGQVYHTRLLISAHGKKSNIDRLLHREFFQKDSDYLGIKYHYAYKIPSNEVSLHNFENGYCGVSMVEKETVNVCYLTTKTALKKYENIEGLEKSIVSKNPYLKDIFENGTRLFEDPKVISDFSFRPKAPVEDGILMAGDSAGLITPLCGNGMAMAIHAAYLCCEQIHTYFNENQQREQLEAAYTETWKKTFEPRLWYGYNIQKLFGKKTMSSLALHAIKITPFLLPMMIRKTHGQNFFPS